MELRLLHYFVTLAEELHFGRAAQRLFISQPPLSVAIRQLEDELQAQLFERSSREVRLTAAGVALRASAQRLLAMAEDAATLGFTTRDGVLSWLEHDEVSALLDAPPSGNVSNPDQYLTSALGQLAQVQSHLDDHGQALAEKLRASHRRVRTASGAVVRGLGVRAESPPDVLGVYVFVPVPKG